eukprot:7642667-Pyramimonas_sp.AAC.1
MRFISRGRRRPRRYGPRRGRSRPCAPPSRTRFPSRWRPRCRTLLLAPPCGLRFRRRRWSRRAH